MLVARSFLGSSIPSSSILVSSYRPMSKPVRDVLYLVYVLVSKLWFGSETYNGEPPVVLPLDPVEV